MSGNVSRFRAALGHFWSRSRSIFNSLQPIPCSSEKQGILLARTGIFRWNRKLRSGPSRGRYGRRVVCRALARPGEGCCSRSSGQPRRLRASSNEFYITIVLFLQDRRPTDSRPTSLQAQRSKFRPKTRGLSKFNRPKLHPAARRPFVWSRSEDQELCNESGGSGYGPVDLREPTVGPGARTAAMGHKSDTRSASAVDLDGPQTKIRRSSQAKCQLQVSLQAS
jgi:hypothetical protein